MLVQNFGVTNEEHYGMLWYFLELLPVGKIYIPNAFFVFHKFSLPVTPSKPYNILNLMSFTKL